MLRLRMTFAMLLLLLQSTTGVGATEPRRFVGSGDLADFALEQEGTSLTLYIASKETSEPLVGGKVALQREGGKDPIAFKASEKPGVYVAETDGDFDTGQVVVEAGDENDIIDLAPANASPDTKAQVATSQAAHEHRPSWVYAALGALVGGLLTGLCAWVLARRGARGASALLAFALVGKVLAGEVASAHEGHDHAPVPGEQPTTLGDVMLPKRSQFLIELRTQPVARKKINEGFVSYGHVVAKPQLDAQLAAPQAGVIRGSIGLTLGQNIEKGQVLANIEALGVIRITSPVAGKLLEVQAVEGARVEAGQSLFRVTDMTSLWVDAELYERELALLSNVKEAFVSVEGAAEPIPAKIFQAQTAIDEGSRTAKVFLEIGNPGNLRLGAFATVHFALNSEAEEISVPISSVLNRGGDEVVFVKTGAETFALRVISTRKASAPGQVIVTSGLADGDLVVTNGSYQLLMKSK